MTAISSVLGTLAYFYKLYRMHYY